MTCTSEHRYDERLAALPDYQGGNERHKCPGCAYELGYQQGLQRIESFNLDLNSLPVSQAGTGRHKSPHAAYAMGYLDGVKQSYR